MPRDSETFSAVGITGPVDVSDRAARLLGIVDTELAAALAAADGLADPTTAPVLAFGMIYDPVGAKWVRQRQGPLPAPLHVTGTAAVNTGVTVTLPAPGAGLFQYITSIELVKLYAVVGVAAAAGVIITSTNLPGGPAWTTEQMASPAGTVARVINYVATTPLKAAIANTAVTLIAPAQLQTIWRWNVSYYIGA